MDFLLRAQHGIGYRLNLPFLSQLILLPLSHQLLLPFGFIPGHVQIPFC
jgi:hypothetical protein